MHRGDSNLGHEKRSPDGSGWPNISNININNFNNIITINITNIITIINTNIITITNINIITIINININLYRFKEVSRYGRFGVQGMGLA